MEPPPEKTLPSWTAASFRKEEPAGSRVCPGASDAAPPGTRLTLGPPRLVLFNERIWNVVSEAPESRRKVRSLGFHVGGYAGCHTSHI